MDLNTVTPFPAFLILVFFLATIPSAYAAEPIWTYTSQGSEIGGVTLSSDGSVIAVGAGKIWLLSGQGALLAKEPYGDLVVMTPDGSYLASAYGPTLCLFKRPTLKGVDPMFAKAWEYTLPANARSIDISDDGKTIVASIMGGGTFIFDASGKKIGGDERLNAIVRLSSRGTRIVGVSPGTLCLYTRTGKCSKTENDLVGVEPDFMEISSFGNISVFNDDQRVRRVFLDNKTLQWTQRATGDVTSLAMTPVGSDIIVGTDNGNIDHFDDSGNRTWSFASNPANKQSAAITSVALSKEGTVAAAGSYDGKIFTLDVNGEEIWSNQTRDRIRHIAMSADGSFVVATGGNTVYAFATTEKPITPAQTPVSSNPASVQPVITVRETVSIRKTGTNAPTMREITAEPTQYSVIRTSTQSPVSGAIPLVAVLAAVLAAFRRR